MPDFSISPSYADIVYVLQNLQPPAGLSKTIARSMKLKAAKFCILNQYLYWKDPGGVLLNCLLENEAQQISNDFRKGDWGGHHSWKVAANKILREGFYWPSYFWMCIKKPPNVISSRFLMERGKWFHSLLIPY